MKLPIIRQFFQNSTAEELETAAKVLEDYSDFRGVSEDELHVIGEILTNLFGAMEVHDAVKDGQSEKDALNGFAQKVMGSIDRH